MLKFLIRRFLSLIPVIFMISLMLFGMFKMMPGDPVLYMLPPGLKTVEQRQEAYDNISQRLGLDKSIPEQYVAWMKNLATGDLGTSNAYNKDVKDVIARPLRNSMYLNIASLILAFAISIPVGIKSAVKQHSFFDSFWQVFTLIGLSVPVFFIGLVLIYLLAFQLKIFPAGGSPMSTATGLAGFLSWSRYLVLPVLTLTFGSLAGLVRYVRNAMIDVINKDYIRTARSKGLSEKVIIYSHAFRNALIPVVTLVAGSLVGIFGGSAITETIFAYNGIGYLLISSLNNRDLMVILAMNMFYAVLSLVANILMDIGYALVDPRVKLN